MMNKIILIILTFFVMNQLAFGQIKGEPQAPFGLRWGMTIDEVKALNLKKFDEYQDKLVRTVRVESVPIESKYDGEYFLDFFPLNRGLRSISFGVNDSGKNYDSLKEKFNLVASNLNNKYGKPVFDERNAHELAKDYEYNQMMVRLRLSKGESAPYVLWVSYEYYPTELFTKDEPILKKLAEKYDNPF
ncbi:hypothetical protein ABLB84_19550 [Xenorhabdus szentirmaii]|uniref:hypothetical protein n=1 Tax=Xenorhabdus szentirmaii TaxID=290112 RepID=UPI0032B80AC1